MSDQATRHAARMAKKKAVIDAAIAKADVEKGLLLVLTGNGKGKSSSAFGMVAPRLGHGMKVAWRSSSRAAPIPVKRLSSANKPGSKWHVLGEGYTWDTQDLERRHRHGAARLGGGAALLDDPGIGSWCWTNFTYLAQLRPAGNGRSARRPSGAPAHAACRRYRPCRARRPCSMPPTR